METSPLLHCLLSSTPQSLLPIADAQVGSQPSIPSPDGLHIASYNAPQLEIRQTKTLDVIRTIHITLNSQSRYLCLRWSQICKGAGSAERFLLADEDTVRVWDIQDAQWSAVITNGTGGMGKISNVEFGGDDTEVALFSSFGAKVTIYSLWTGRSVEIRDPKFAFKGHGRNRSGRNGIFALLTRPAAQDVVSLHAFGTYEILKSINLPSVDAQGLKWSPDGKWLAIWDTPSTGYRVLIYTADGNLYRTYSGDYYEDGLAGLGVKSIEWSPSGDFLAIGGYEKTVTLLSTRTFSPAVHLAHPSSVQLSSGTVWQEQALTSEDRIYNVVYQRTNPPTALSTSGDPQSRVGFSIIGFNADGTYLATKNDSMPTAVWIWDLARLRASAVLMQHATVKRLLWHPTDPDLLLIQCIQGESILYLWNASDQQPQVLSLGSVRLSGKAEAQWIRKYNNRNPSFLFGDALGFILAFPEGPGEASPFLEAQDDQAHGFEKSTDSLYEILSGRKAVVEPDLPYESDADADAANGHVQDTFQFRHDVSVK